MAIRIERTKQESFPFRVDVRGEEWLWVLGEQLDWKYFSSLEATLRWVYRTAGPVNILIH